ncbi:hypothetical protein [Kitasatospora sp. NPDC050543]|uniref:hypothetical protein n=1 Tax=Kitasatospora sp. NPDC050543 TaxID=3364054 RepID=UPI0037B005C4
METRGSRRGALLAAALLAALAGMLTALLPDAGSSGRARPLADSGHSGQPARTPADADAGPQSSDLASRVDAYTSLFSASASYRIPDAARRRALADGVTQLLDSRPEQAARTVERVGYRLSEFVDQGSGRRVAEIADASPQSAAERGWGRVYLDLSAKTSWVVQVPHPVFDSRTEALGVELFRAAPGGVFVLAGAHRKAGADGSSDPAHRTDTVFAAVIEALAGRGLPAIQLHGFDEGSLPGQDAVVSVGTAAPGPAAQLTADGLGRAGFAVCRAWRDRCGHLEGTTNVEGRFAADLGVPWLHVELANALRTDAQQRSRVAAALAATARSWSGATAAS